MWSLLLPPRRMPESGGVEPSPSPEQLAASVPPLKAGLHELRLPFAAVGSQPVQNICNEQLFKVVCWSAAFQPASARQAEASMLTTHSPLGARMTTGSCANRGCTGLPAGSLDLSPPNVTAPTRTKRRSRLGLVA